MKKDAHDNIVSLSKRTAANRRNAQLSTGPRTEEGKSRSRQNALKHGILASAVLITTGEGVEDPAEFNDLLSALTRDLAPVGTLEEILVEKIAICCWRQKRALRCEVGMLERAFVSGPEHQLEESVNRILDLPQNPKLAAVKEHLSLPLGADLDRILRYETTIQRQLVYAINQLERLQRTRKGEHVPAPLSVQLSSDD